MQTASDSRSSSPPSSDCLSAGRYTFSDTSLLTREERPDVRDGREAYEKERGPEQVVPATRPDGEAVRLRARARHFRPKALRVRHLGAHPGRPRRPFQGDRTPERVLPAPHPGELSQEGGRDRRGLRPRARVGDDGGAREARGTARRPANLREHHLRLLQRLGPELPGPPDPHQPVVQRDALGEGHPSVPAHRRVSLAGGAHRTRHRRGVARGGAADAGRLPQLLLRGARHPGSDGPQESLGALPWGARDLYLRGPYG